MALPEYIFMKPQPKPTPHSEIDAINTEREVG